MQVESADGSALFLLISLTALFLYGCFLMVPVYQNLLQNPIRLAAWGYHSLAGSGDGLNCDAAHVKSMIFITIYHFCIDEKLL
jgi:hypothetical protein